MHTQWWGAACCALMLLLAGCGASVKKPSALTPVHRQIMAAIAADNGDQIRKLLEDDSGDLVDVNDDLGRGRTFLMMAAAGCHPNATEELLRWGSRVDVREGPRALPVVWLAAQACAQQPDTQSARRVMAALVGAGATLHASHDVGRPGMGVTEPDAFRFVDLCNRGARAATNFAPVLEELMRGGRLDSTVRVER